MDLGIDGRVALVTGASRGIAKEISRELVAEGANVAIASRDPGHTKQAAQEIGAQPFTYDSAEYGDSQRLIDDVQSALGPIEILVTSTGGPPTGPDPLGFDDEQWRHAYATLVRSPIELIAAVMPGMRQRGFGRVVNIASTTVREPTTPLMLSNTHRSGTLAALKTIAREVAADGMTVNSVLPGRVATERLFQLYGSRDAAETAGAADVPAGRLGTVEELAAAAVFLCSARASYITGVALLVDGGLTRLI
jgi:3-oxoacyl-[acyl-carrier protein] reductase